MSSGNQYSKDRRQFLITSGSAIAGAVMATSAGAVLAKPSMERKRRVALVGTGIRGTNFWGKNLVDNYGDVLEFVALCDINPGRVTFAKSFMNVSCPTFTDFDEMLEKVPLDLLLVCTTDATHDEFIVKGLNHDIDVITEKPMTTDETKCAAIVNAQRKSKSKLIMGFNYRYGHLFTELKDLLHKNEVGRLVSIDLNWYLNVHHGSAYFRRWHGERDKSGTLLLHKSAHHFDLLNWWIDSDPVEVHAFGALEFYGKNNPFRGKNCRDCRYTKKCQFYWDINETEFNQRLYTDNEKFDGYIRDNCLWRKEVDIFDKMVVQIRYANNVQVSYSLSTYSPYEGFRLAFNGFDGRMETWEGLPWLEAQQTDQSKIYETGMAINQHSLKELDNFEISISENFKGYRQIKLPYIRRGHWGGDKVMTDAIFRGISPKKDYGQAATVRDGSMAVLIGIAARKSIDEGRMIKITELTDLKPKVKRSA
ncbi:MAG: Gfo/Idh/MocA family oxidoreductase [Gammaproteobacteria bacterium]|nr:Gfo/Idh/MocA family oxidoreductase [Gammaproteobacteria bacterium]